MHSVEVHLPLIHERLLQSSAALQGCPSVCTGRQPTPPSCAMRQPEVVSHTAQMLDAPPQ
jgi:hypothetical protein